MKKTLFVIAILFTLLMQSQNCNISPFEAAIVDDSGTDTNVRTEPNGDVFLKLNYKDDFVANVVDYQEGWLKVNTIISVYNNYEITSFSGWIHQSTVGFWTRKKVNLLDKPKTGTSLGFIEQENGPVKVKSICGKWIKIEFQEKTGWIELEWLCGNPVTTCP